MTKNLRDKHYEDSSRIISAQRKSTKKEATDSGLGTVCACACPCMCVHARVHSSQQGDTETKNCNIGWAYSVWSGG